MGWCESEVGVVAAHGIERLEHVTGEETFGVF